VTRDLHLSATVKAMTLFMGKGKSAARSGGAGQRCFPGKSPLDVTLLVFSSAFYASKGRLILFWNRFCS
jgi:hypothetical protein